MVSRNSPPRRDARATEHGRVSPFALVIVAVFVVGIAAWASSWHRLPPSPSAPAHVKAKGPVDTAITDRSIDQALAVAGLDSIAYKSRWLDDVRGIDDSKLTDKQKEIFVRFANAERCTCGCGYTLAGCKASDMTCEVSGASLAALLDSVQTRRITSARGIRSKPAASRINSARTASQRRSSGG